MEQIKILVIDLGSQYTLVIGRTLRELGFRSAILPPAKANVWLKNNKPQAIILSGGSASVYEPDSPQPPAGLFSSGVPILGICFGMQWLARELGGNVSAHREKKEYGKTEIVYEDTKSALLAGISGKKTAWASHGDSIEKLPAGFSVLATSGKGKTIAAMGSEKKKIWGVQFHPEVTHTQEGRDILNNFIANIAGCRPDWIPEDIIGNIRDEAKAAVKDKKAIIGFSGGVDSTALAAIVAPVLKENLLAVCIDTGALRKDEMEEVKVNAQAAGVGLKIVKAAARFQKEMKTRTDAEKKRAAFKKTYVAILEEEAKKFGASFILQGSLATDYIESGGAGEAALIKSHHNIGNKWKLSDLHPVRNLFKYEIRALAKELGLPDSIAERQPFPGPGLFIRIVGIPATAKNLEVLKEADAIVTSILRKHNIYRDISQLIVALIGIKTVGIKGDGRSYAYPILVRGVVTRDFMTVSGFHFPADVQKEIEKAITTLPAINRVWFDATDKPPATTELE